MDDNQILIEIDCNVIGRNELEDLYKLSEFNKFLNKQEFFEIINVYAGVIDRISAKVPELNIF